MVNSKVFEIGSLLILLSGCPVLGWSSTPEQQPGGYFSVSNIDGRWWFLDPSGKQFVSLGINHIEPVLLLGALNKQQYIDRYGSDLVFPDGSPNNRGDAARRWMEDSMSLIRSWGFNTIGMHNPIPQSSMPYVATFRPAEIDGWANLKRKYPDPFDPAVRRNIDEQAEQWARNHRNDPRILGICFNDMPLFRLPVNGYHEWISSVMRMPDESPAKQAWVDLLRKYYTSPEQAARAYRSKAATWEEFLHQTQWPLPRSQESIRRDQLAFLPVLVDAWYDLVSGAVRRHDPHHLILGDKFEGAADLPEWLDPIIGKHFDVVFIQWYATADQQLTRLKKLHETCGRPILMGDSSFSCPSPRLPHPKGVYMSSQAEVGNAYWNYLQSVMTQPFILGWHHCGFIEGSPDLAKFHPYYAIQCGFLMPDGTPHLEAVEKVSKANSQAFDWHSASHVSSPHQTPVAKPLMPLPETPEANRTPSDTEGHRGPNPGRRCRTTRTPEYTFTRIDDNVYNLCAIKAGESSVPNKNISWIVTNDGVIVIDTGFPPTAAVAKKIIRQTTDLPIRYIIYTHHHGTQVAGAAVLKEKETRIIAHEDLVLEFDLAKEFHAYNARRDSIQFNINPHPGIPNLVYPDITFSDTYELECGGIRLHLCHADAESRDYSLVFMPDQKIVWVADMLGNSVPLVGSPMKVVRDELKWKKALEKILAWDPDVLIQSTEIPFEDKRIIQNKLQTSIRFLEFLRTSVAREMNKGSTEEEALNNIRMPEDLASSPYMHEHYGTLEFDIRGVYRKYSGWFDQNGTNLKPVSRSVRAASFMDEMGGPQAVLSKARQLRQSNQYALALEYLDLLIDAGGLLQEAHFEKALILEKLSTIHRSNPLMVNMYKRLAVIERSKAGRQVETPTENRLLPARSP